MADRRVDPARLEGATLNEWYRRTPEMIEKERRALEAQQYESFVGGRRAQPPTEWPGPESQTPVHRGDPDALWVANGYGSWRPVGRASPGFELLPDHDPRFAEPSTLPVTPDTRRGEFIPVGNPATPRLRREYERKEGYPWPREPNGRRHDVAHIRAKADGGTDTVENIRPMPRDEHIAEHKKNGDFSRWGKRSGGSKRAPQPGAPTVRGLGFLGILPNITGLLSGRIRMDTFDNFTSDMLGLPSEEDQRRAFEDRQRTLNPKWKPGDPFMT